MRHFRASHGRIHQMSRSFPLRAAVLAAVAGLASSALIAPTATAGEWDAIHAWETAKVSRIVDGDTMIVVDEVTGAESRVRFIGLNAPEKETKSKPGQCGWWQATDDLAELAPVGSRVRLASLDASSKGRSDRPQRVVLAWNKLTDEFDIDLSWAMAERGWGVWFTVPHEAAMSAKYRDVIARAQQRQVGIWDPTLCGEREQPDAQLDIRIGRVAAGSTDQEEWVTVRNMGQSTVDLSGWTLRDSGITGWFTFPGGSVLAPGDYRTVFTGKGTAGSRDGHDLYVGAKVKLYQNPGTGPYLVGDGAYLLDKAGAYRFWREYPCTGACTTDPLAGVTVDSVFLGRKKGRTRAQTQMVRVANWGQSTVCMDGARIESGTSTYRFKPGVCIAPGTMWSLLGGSGADTATTGHWNKTVPALWASGTLTLRDDLNRVVATRTW